jgi:hypothetical protein
MACNGRLDGLGSNTSSDTTARAMGDTELTCTLYRGVVALFSGLMPSRLTLINGIAVQDNVGHANAGISHCLRTPVRLS